MKDKVYLKLNKLLVLHVHCLSRSQVMTASGEGGGGRQTVQTLLKIMEIKE